ncbi:MAG: diacylglycerol kinase [Actinobacteria bacterium]|nr:diacylglycerol kinase [Actinomycetota bacterium]
MLVNDNAGTAEQDRVDAVVAAFRDADVATAVHETASTDEVDDVVRLVGDDDVLVVCGGDGSLHLAVERARAADRLADLTFAVVPMGTGNDLARFIGTSDDVDEAVAGVLAGEARALDLIVDDRGTACVNALHAGIGVEAAERAQGMKDRVGNAAYAIGAVIAGLAAEGRTLTVELDGARLTTEDPEAQILLVAVLNGATFGGGTPVAPAARPDDGLLDVVVTTAVRPAARAAFAAALRSGTHLDRGDVVWRQGREVRIAGERVGYNVDGELDPDGSSDRTFHIEPGAWRLVHPPAAPGR